MKTRNKLTALAIVTFLSAIGAGRQAQAFTEVFDEYQAAAIMASGRWISAVIERR